MLRPKCGLWWRREAATGLPNHMLVFWVRPVPGLRRHASCSLCAPPCEPRVVPTSWSPACVCSLGAGTTPTRPGGGGALPPRASPPPPACSRAQGSPFSEPARSPHGSFSHRYHWTCTAAGAPGEPCFTASSPHSLRAGAPSLSFPASSLSNSYDQFLVTLTVSSAGRNSSEAQVFLSPRPDTALRYCVPRAPCVLGPGVMGGRRDLGPHRTPVLRAKGPD